LPWAVLIRLFPDVWFEKTVKVTTWPLVVVWKPTSRVMGRLTQKMKHNKKAQDAEEEGKKDSPVSAPEIRIEEEERPVDIEKGRPQEWSPR